MELRTVPIPDNLIGMPFRIAAEWLFRTSNVTMIGIETAGPEATVLLNPGRKQLQEKEVTVIA